MDIFFIIEYRKDDGQNHIWTRDVVRYYDLNEALEEIEKMKKRSFYKSGNVNMYRVVRHTHTQEVVYTEEKR